MHKTNLELNIFLHKIKIKNIDYYLIYQKVKKFLAVLKFIKKNLFFCIS